MGVHAFDVLGDPVRRRILELLAEGELTAGAIGTTIQAEFAITQPAVKVSVTVNTRAMARRSLMRSGYRTLQTKRLQRPRLRSQLSLPTQ